MNIVIIGMPTTNLFFTIEDIEESYKSNYRSNCLKIRGALFESARLAYRHYGPRAKQYVIDFCEYILATNRCEEYFDDPGRADYFNFLDIRDPYEFFYSFFVSVVGRPPNLNRDFSNIQFTTHQNEHTHGSILLSL